MSQIVFTEHAQDMLKERNIKESWVWDVIKYPTKKTIEDDGNLHYLGTVQEYENKVLRVVVNGNCKPKKVVTIFFDRRVRDLNETKS